MTYVDDESHVERFRDDEGDVDINKLRTEFAFTGDDMGDADQGTDSADGEIDSSDTEPTSCGSVSLVAACSASRRS